MDVTRGHASPKTSNTLSHQCGPPTARDRGRGGTAGSRVWHMLPSAGGARAPETRLGVTAGSPAQPSRAGLGRPAEAPAPGRELCFWTCPEPPSSRPHSTLRPCVTPSGKSTEDGGLTLPRHHQPSTWAGTRVQPLETQPEGLVGTQLSQSRWVGPLCCHCRPVQADVVPSTSKGGTLARLPGSGLSVSSGLCGCSRGTGA